VGGGKEEDCVKDQTGGAITGPRIQCPYRLSHLPVRVSRTTGGRRGADVDHQCRVRSAAGSERCLVEEWKLYGTWVTVMGAGQASRNEDSTTWHDRVNSKTHARAVPAQSVARQGGKYTSHGYHTPTSSLARNANRSNPHSPVYPLTRVIISQAPFHSFTHSPRPTV